MSTERVKEILQEWVNLQGHDLCWYHPEAIRGIAKVWNVDLTGMVSVPALGGFKENCDRYRRDLYHGNDNSNVTNESPEEAFRNWVDSQKGVSAPYHHTILSRLATSLGVERTNTPELRPEYLFEGGCDSFHWTIRESPKCLY